MASEVFPVSQRHVASEVLQLALERHVGSEVEVPLDLADRRPGYYKMMGHHECHYEICYAFDGS